MNIKVQPEAWKTRDRIAVGACILLTILTAFGLVGPAGGFQLLLLALTAMVPISLAAVGEIINERAGLFNIGIEGIMLLSAFVSVVLAERAGNWVTGTLIAAITGGFLALTFGLLATYARASQLILGVGLNLFAVGVVGYGLVALWKSPGFRLISGDLRIPKLFVFSVPFSYFIPISILLPFLTHFFLERTRFGLHAKAAGFNPFVTDVSGINVYTIRIIACTIGGTLAGLAGAYMALDWVGLISSSLIQGRGFIAIACVIFGGLDPVLTFEGALLFGLVNAVGLWLQNLPWTAFLMLRGGSHLFLVLPYLTVLSVLIIFPRRERLSKTIGVPYRRA